MKIPSLALAFVLLLTGGLPEPASAQSGHDLLQRALVMERAEGNLDGAVVLYNKILEEHKKDRALCARALFQMASFFERLGRSEAADAYQRIMEEYPDQADQARQARIRLEGMVGNRIPTLETPSTAVPDPTFTLLFEDELPFGQGAGGTSLSPDGRRLLLWIRGRGVYLFDPVTALPRHILPFRDPAERVNMARWSPDGTRIAVLHLTRIEAGGPLGESILIIDPEGNEISRLSIRTSPGPVGWYGYSLAWAPGQQALVYARRGVIYSITLDGRETELTPEGSVGGAPMLGGYSPDGRWLAYSTDIPGDTGREDHDVWVMPASGGSARKLTHHPDRDLTPAWGADGSLYFASARSGSRNIWRMRIDPDSGERVGDPEQVTFFQDAQVTWPSPAAEGGKMAFIIWGLRETVRVADAANPGTSTTLARGEAISLSPDGKQLLYSFELNDEAAYGVRNDAIYSVPTSGGVPVRLSPESHSGIRDAGFSPDGSMVVYSAMGTGDGPREFQVPAAGGETTLVRRIAPIQMPDADDIRLSPDRSVAVFVSGSGLYSLPLSGGDPTLLAEAPGWQGEIEFSPDGRYVAANGSQRSSRGTESFWPSDIYLVSLEDGETRRLTSGTEGTEKFWLAWHPDGERLTFRSRSREGHRTTRMAYVDGRPTTLFHDEPEVQDGEGRWAPDGESFFFVGTDSEGNRNTYRLRSDGSVDLLWEGGALPIVSADGATYAFTHNAISAQLWMMEGFR